ncbi:MAG: zinc-binding dehydrogenase, partial [Armatimonadota bacterium]
LATQMGADMTVDVCKDDYGTALLDWTDGRGPDVVIEAVGTAATVRHAFELAAHAGRVVVLGIVAEDIAVPGQVLVRKELDVFGSRMNARLFPDVLRLLQAGSVDPRPFITHSFPLENAVEALQLARDNPEEAVKVLLLP